MGADTSPVGVANAAPATRLCRGTAAFGRWMLTSRPVFTSSLTAAATSSKFILSFSLRKLAFGFVGGSFDHLFSRTSSKSGAPALVMTSKCATM